jgi:hypothetical protein
LDDIIDLCDQDRATGEGVKTGVEADEIMTPIEETSVIDLDSDTQGQEELNIGDDYLSPNTTNSQRKQIQASTTSMVAHAKKRMISKDVFVDSMAKMISHSRNSSILVYKLDVGEIYDEVPDRS